MTHAVALSPGSARDWYATLPDPAVAIDFAGQASVRRYTGTPSEMRQPPLSENVICMHLGGAKEIQRWHDGHQHVHSIEMGALTILPAEQSNRWLTRGPVDFAHILLSPELSGQVTIEEFDGDPQGFRFTDLVGFRDPYLEMLFGALLDAIERPRATGRLYADSLLVVLMVRLLQSHSTLGRSITSDAGATTYRRGGLAPWRLRRVTDYFEQHLVADISLADLTALTDLSRAQFFRAFKQSTGQSPHRYLTAMRLDTARTLLQSGDLHPSDVGRAVGLPSPARFAALFRQRFGLTLNGYRASVRSGKTSRE